MKPFYSVIIPSHGGGVKIKKVLYSLLRQSIAHELFEIVLVDDAIPQDKKFDLSALRKEFKTLQLCIVELSVHGGPARARNAGARAAKGSILFFTDSDCEVPALWMETHLRMYKDHPEVVGVGGWYKTPNALIKKNLYELFMYLHYEASFMPININLYAGKSSELPFALWYNFPAINTANLSVARGAFLAVGGFDERYVTPGGEDLALSEAIRRKGLILAYIPQMVLHSKNLTFKKFLKTAIYRGIGMYTRGRIDSYSRTTMSLFVDRYVSHVRTMAKTYPHIASREVTLILLGRIFYFIYHSSAARFFYKYAWERKLKQYEQA